MMESGKGQAPDGPMGPRRRGRRKAEIRHALHLVRRNRLVLAGSIIAMGTILLAILSGVLVDPNGWNRQNSHLRLCWNNDLIQWGIRNLYVCPVSKVFPLGTDAQGRDLLQMIILAIPLDLEIAFEIVASSILIGLAVGGAAGYLGGKIDEIVLRVTDIFFALP